MRKMMALSLAVYTISFLFASANAQQDPITDEQRDAGAVLEKFLNAQAEGRTDILKETLGGDLLKKRSRLLGNPDYPVFLQDAYAGTRNTILDYKTIADNTIQIDVEFVSDRQESKRMRFILMKKSPTPSTSPQFLIYSQTEITQ
jgi:hypothetical protein